LALPAWGQSARLAAERAGDGAVLGVQVRGGGAALILADGYVVPRGEVRVSVRLLVDGAPVGSAAVLDWHGTHYPVAHSFRVLAAPALTGGAHDVALSVQADGPVSVGAGSVLSVLPRPATQVRQQMADTGDAVVQVNTLGGLSDKDALPHRLFARVRAGAGAGPVVALAAGSVAYEGDGKTDFGDALWGFWLDGAEPTGNEASYADNDICRCAELGAPLAMQAFFPAGVADGRVIGAGATAEPWGTSTGTNHVAYRVLPESALVVLAGGMRVAGSASVLDAAHGGDAVKRFPYFCAGSAHGYVGCPKTGSAVTVAEGDVSVPAGHRRPVLFSAALRIQGASHDKGGRFDMWLELDGRRVGADGVQDLAAKSSVSTRTVTVSYLAEGLPEGAHHVALVARASGDFEHLAVTRNVPVIWFD
jgi:hypothetical protein